MEELLAWEWSQVDWKQGFVTLNAGETKTGYSRAVPILKGDMCKWLTWALGLSVQVCVGSLLQPRAGWAEGPLAVPGRVPRLAR